MYKRIIAQDAESFTEGPQSYGGSWQQTRYQPPAQGKQ